MSITLNINNYPLVVGNENKITFEKWETAGSTVKIVANMEDTLYEISDLMWESENSEIAEIIETKDNHCTVRGRTTGVTAIRAILPDCSVAKCVITVIDNLTRSTTKELQLNVNNLKMKVGNYADLISIQYPEDLYATNKESDWAVAKTLNTEILWLSSNEAVASVDKGRIHAKGIGECTITARTADNGRTARCSIQVLEESGVSGIVRITEPFIETIEGEKVQIAAKAVGKTCGISYRSKNSYVADVDENGLVVAYASSMKQKVSADRLNVQDKSDTIEIIATTDEGGYTTTFQLAVKKSVPTVEQISLSTKKYVLIKGKQGKIHAAISPGSLVASEIQWYSSDDKVIDIDKISTTEDGLSQCTFEAHEIGTCTLVAEYKGKTSYCEIEVRDGYEASAINIINSPEEMEIDERFKVEVDANLLSDDSIFWISTNNNIASANSEGIVSAREAGNVDIFAIIKSSLDEQELQTVGDMMAVRNISEDENQLMALMNLKVKTYCTFFNLVVKNDRPELRNLHIPKESVTEDSVKLLWNRDSVINLSTIEHYEIYCNNSLYCITDKMSQTVGDLKPNTNYEMTVVAIGQAGMELAKKYITVVTKPVSTVINVVDEPYGAVGSGYVTDTLAIQQAIDDCPLGGTVLLPEGYVFYTGALFLKSNMNFRVDGVLMGSDNPKDYPWVVSRWEGFRKLPQEPDDWKNSTEMLRFNTYVRASLINAGTYDEGEPGIMGPYNIENVRICGKGQINANGFRLAYNEGPNKADYGKGQPVPFSPVLNQTFRGSILRFHNARFVYVSDLTLAYGPGWQVHPIYCSNMTFDNLRLVSIGNGVTGATDDQCILNGDGIDPESSTFVNIVECIFECGDDSVTLKSGRNKEGNELNKPCAYIRVTDCVADGCKAGFVIGSEIASGAHDVLFQNIEIRNIPELFGFWIKTMASRGGIIEDITYRDATIENVKTPIYISMDYITTASSPANVNPADTHPKIRYLKFENISDLGGNSNAIEFSGSSQEKISHVKLHHVFSEDAMKKMIIRDCEKFDID